MSSQPVQWHGQSIEFNSFNTHLSLVIPESVLAEKLALPNHCEESNFVKNVSSNIGTPHTCNPISECTAFAHGLMDYDPRPRDAAMPEEMKIRLQQIFSRAKRQTTDSYQYEYNNMNVEWSDDLASTEASDDCESIFFTDEESSCQNDEVFSSKEQLQHLKKTLPVELKQSTRSTPSEKSCWMNDEMARKCRKLDIFDDKRLNNEMSHLLECQPSFFAAMNASIRCFWPEGIRQKLHIPPSPGSITRDLSVPQCQLFHSLWKSLEPDDETERIKFRSKVSVYICMANKYCRHEQRVAEECDDVRSSIFSHPKCMNQMKTRCKNLIKKSYQATKKGKCHEKNLKWLEMAIAASKSCEFFSDRHLNKLLYRLISHCPSLWLAIKNVALVFWPRSYLQNHYVSCSSPKTRLTSRKPARGANVFHSFWFHLVPHQNFPNEYVQIMKHMNNSIRMCKMQSDAH